MRNDEAGGAAVNIDHLLDELTLEEQVSLMAGADFWTTVPIPRLGIPAVKVSDGPNGARGAGGLTNGTPAAAFPCAIALGASWSTDSAYAMGTALAAEARSKGARVLLAPTVNMHRSGLNGRNFECYSEDPLLTSMLAVAYIRGLQDNGVGATIKHFVANDSEIDRQTVSSDVDERTLREIYLPPFEAAVKKAGVWAVMTGYNRLNGVHMDGHTWALKDVMRGQFGYDGIFMSDWFGTNSVAESVNAGHDLEMPGPTRYRGARLLDAVKAGEVDPETIRAATRRLLVLFERVGAFDGTGPEPETARDAPETRALIRRLGAQGAVLLKNQDDLLPLKKNISIAALGPNAAVARLMGGGSAQINAPYRVTPIEGLKAAFGDNRVSHERGCSNSRLTQALQGDIELSYFHGRCLEGTPVHTETENALNCFWFDLPVSELDPNDFSVRAVAAFTPQESGTFRAGMTNVVLARAYLDGELLIDGETDWVPGQNFFGTANDERRVEVELKAGTTYQLVIDYRSPETAERGITVRALRFGIEKTMGQQEIDDAVRLAGEQDVAVLFVGRQEEWDSEGYDLPDMTLPGEQNVLIEAVAAVNPNTVVVLQTGGPVEMPWLDKVKSVVQFWYPGQEVGNAIADVLSGAAYPGGRLPQTFPKRMKDNSAWSSDALTYPGKDGHVRYDEGVFVGYRHHDSHHVPPLFPFGFGLGYTQMTWGEASADAGIMTDVGITVTVPLANAGAVDGVEVVQLYVHPQTMAEDVAVARPEKELRAFARLALKPGESGQASLHILPRDLAYFDVERQRWVAPAGRYAFLVAANAGDIRQRLMIELPSEWSEPA
ncbi:MAG: glycosyl hydrolase [Rhizobiaceae bacterium]|nr:glycosyl hydrolase [Rhizobiaceae bacterium]